LLCQILCRGNSGKAAAVSATKTIIAQTGINLAGFDFLFASNALAHNTIEPLLLEVNYFFGRRGLGGSEQYYPLLVNAIEQWIADMNLSYKRLTNL